MPSEHAGRSRMARFDSSAPAAPPEAGALLADLRRQIIAGNWSDPGLLVRAAVLLADQGQRGEAVSMLRRALQLDRNHVYARAKLGELASPDEIAALDLPAPSRPLSKNPGEPFRYACRGNGKWVLLAGTLFFSLVFLAVGAAGDGGILGWPLIVTVLVAGTGYFFTYLGNVIRETATGSTQASDWPGWEAEMLAAAGKAVLFSLVPMGPALAWAIVSAAAGGIPPGLRVAVLAVLALAGMAVLPMMLLIMFTHKSLWAVMNLAFVLRSIWAVRGEYLWVALIWNAVATPALVFVFLFAGAIPAGGIPAAGLLVFGLTAGGRAVGMVLQSHREQLGWFAR